MAKAKKDGLFFNVYMDRTLHDRLNYYAEEMGQTKTLALERILKKHLDEAGVPEHPKSTSKKEDQ